LQLIELLAREWLHGMGIDELRHRGGRLLWLG
jgi:hypothetical protein